MNMFLLGKKRLMPQNVFRLFTTMQFKIITIVQKRTSAKRIYLLSLRFKVHSVFIYSSYIHLNLIYDYNIIKMHQLSEKQKC